MYGCVPTAWRAVTLFTSVWIETVGRDASRAADASRSSRACGLKRGEKALLRLVPPVTLFTSVWIETASTPWVSMISWVTLFTSVWIETVPIPALSHPRHQSRSSRACGLKRDQPPPVRLSRRVTLFTSVWIETNDSNGRRARLRVTLFTSVWIETRPPDSSMTGCTCHALHERVD